MSSTELGMLGLVFVAGVAAGFVNVMAGGGSSLTLPALMLLGLDASVANGTNRLSIVTQSLAGVWAYRQKGKLEERAIAPVLAPTVLGSLVGALTASLAPTAVLKPVLLGTLILIALVMALRPAAAFPEDETPKQTGPRSLFFLFLAGVYGGFIQAGVGFVLLAVLGGVLRYDILRANALKLVCTLVFGVVALGVFVWAGQVDWLPAAVLAVATVIGSQLGVRFALDIDKRVLKRIVLVCVVVSCVVAFLR